MVHTRTVNGQCNTNILPSFFPDSNLSGLNCFSIMFDFAAIFINAKNSAESKLFFIMIFGSFYRDCNSVISI